MQTDLIQLHCKNVKKGIDILMHNENRAIVSLKKNQDLILRTVDKRGSDILMNKVYICV